MLALLKKIFGAGPKVNFKELADAGALVLDVRTAAEFKSGHIKGAVNIPVDSIRSHVQELQQKDKPVITCCRSGARSSRAAAILQQSGMAAYNGGPWQVLQSKINS